MVLNLHKPGNKYYVLLVSEMTNRKKNHFFIIIMEQLNIKNGDCILYL